MEATRWNQNDKTQTKKKATTRRWKLIPREVGIRRRWPPAGKSLQNDKNNETCCLMWWKINLKRFFVTQTTCISKNEKKICALFKCFANGNEMTEVVETIWMAWKERQVVSSQMGIEVRLKHSPYLKKKPKVNRARWWMQWAWFSLALPRHGRSSLEGWEEEEPIRKRMAGNPRSISHRNTYRLNGDTPVLT